MTPALSFADPVFESQAAFRAVLNAVASPGKVFVGGEVYRPRRRYARPPRRRCWRWRILRRRCLSRWIFLSERRPPSICASTPARPIAATPDKAAFALELATDAALDLARFAEGDPEYPDRSTTLVLQVGFRRRAALAPSWPRHQGRNASSRSRRRRKTLSSMQANGQKFPLGVDLILVAGALLVAAPRSTQISEAG